MFRPRSRRPPPIAAPPTAPTALVIALVIALAAVSCGPAGPTPTAGSPTLGDQPGFSLPLYSPGPTPTPEDPAVLYARIEQQVQEIRGLTAKAPISPKVLDEAGLMASLREHFDRDNPPALIAATEKLYRALGMLPDDASLKDLYLKLLGSQVAGFYDPDEKQLFVVSRSGGLGPAEQVTFAHEFDHALQDQNFGLKKLGTAVPDQSDRSLARLSLAEGDATLLMSDWAQAYFTPVQMLQLLQTSVDPAQNAVLTSMPPILRDQLLFPYTRGLAFVQGLWATGSWAAVDGAYATPPDSTEQIMHPEKYVAHEAPSGIEIPGDLAARLGAGWRVDVQDTMGEFGLMEWLLRGGGVSDSVASAAAAGWGGDRLVLASSGSTFGVAVQTTWDTTADAAEFAAAAGTALASMAGKTALVHHGDTRVAFIVASDSPTVGRLRDALGISV
jgi:hypothetical protein